VGSHGGQSQGFLVYPADLPGPGEVVGAEALHRVVRYWLTHLGHPGAGDRGGGRGGYTRLRPGTRSSITNDALVETSAPGRDTWSTPRKSTWNSVAETRVRT
jgi:hypothetical protein